MPGDLFPTLDPGPPLLPGHRHSHREPAYPFPLLLRGRETMHRGARADTPRIPADDVETLAHTLREDHRGGGVREIEIQRQDDRAAPTRTARVEEERADSAGRVGRLMADQGQLNGPLTRPRIIKRHTRRRAVEPSLTRIAAWLPVELRHSQGQCVGSERAQKRDRQKRCRQARRAPQRRSRPLRWWKARDDAFSSGLDQSTDDADTHLAGELAPAVQRLGQMDIHATAPRDQGQPTSCLEVRNGVESGRF